jgi:hypothetical protein
MMGKWTFRVGEGTYYTTGGTRGPTSSSGGYGCFLLLCILVALAALLAIPYTLAYLLSNNPYDSTGVTVGVITLVIEIGIIVSIVRAQKKREHAEWKAEWDAQAPARARAEQITTGIKFYEDQGLTMWHSIDFPCPVCDRGPGLACKDTQPITDVHTGRCVAFNPVTKWQSRSIHDQLQPGPPDWKLS